MPLGSKNEENGGKEINSWYQKFSLTESQLI